MKAIDRPYTQLINGSTQFIIPVFQRDYAWTDAQCRDLWNDLIAAGSPEASRGHFLGSIVYVSTRDSAAGFTRWLLIDGQQRVTSPASSAPTRPDMRNRLRGSSGPFGDRSGCEALEVHGERQV
jgi:hypothetical protein